MAIMSDSLNNEVSIGEHLEEFRKTLLKLILTCFISTLITLYQAEKIIQFLVMPSRETIDSMEYA